MAELIKLRREPDQEPNGDDGNDDDVDERRRGPVEEKRRGQRGGQCRRSQVNWKLKASGHGNMRVSGPRGEGHLKPSERSKAAQLKLVIDLALRKKSLQEVVWMLHTEDLPDQTGVIYGGTRP